MLSLLLHIEQPEIAFLPFVIPVPCLAADGYCPNPYFTLLLLLVQVKCPNCPVHMERIRTLTTERDNLQRMITERDRIIAELRARLEKLEIELKNWHSEKSKMETIIRERETTIRELRRLLDERKDWVPVCCIKGAVSGPQLRVISKNAC